MAEPETVRAFIAVHVPETVRKRLRAAQQELESAMPSDAVRWTVFDQLHITLEFLGNIRSDGIAEMHNVLAEVARAHRPFELNAEVIGAFSSVHNPRVLWVGLSGNVVVLTALQAGVRSAVTRFVAEPETRAYRPHITLGRVREIPARDLRKVSAVLAAGATREFGAWTVGDFALVQSKLSPHGAMHSALATFPLRS
jgi:RNA 2',3'-cyclic 3'-phosphodiesterase